MSAEADIDAALFPENEVAQLRATLERMAEDLNSSQVLLGIALHKMGGTMTVQKADYEAVRAKAIVGDATGEDFVLRLVGVPSKGVH